MDHLTILKQQNAETLKFIEEMDLAIASMDRERAERLSVLVSGGINAIEKTCSRIRNEAMEVGKVLDDFDDRWSAVGEMAKQIVGMNERRKNQ